MFLETGKRVARDSSDDQPRRLNQASRVQTNGVVSLTKSTLGCFFVCFFFDAAGERQYARRAGSAPGETSPSRDLDSAPRRYRRRGRVARDEQRGHRARGAHRARLGSRGRAPDETSGAFGGRRDRRAGGDAVAGPPRRRFGAPTPRVSPVSFGSRRAARPESLHRGQGRAPGVPSEGPRHGDG